MGTKIYISGARASYPHLAQPHAAVQGGSMRYGVNLIVAQSDPVWQQIQQAIQSEIAAAWPSGQPANLTMPDIPAAGEGESGVPAFTVKAYAYNPPGVADQHGRPAMDKTLIYAGCYVNAWVSVYTYKTPRAGVTFGLEGVQFLRDGEPLGNRMSVEEMFKPVEGAPPAVAPGVVPVPPAPPQAPVQPVPQAPAQQPAPPVVGGNPWD